MKPLGTALWIYAELGTKSEGVWEQIANGDII